MPFGKQRGLKSMLCTSILWTFFVCFWWFLFKRNNQIYPNMICQFSHPEERDKWKAFVSRHILFLEENIINPCSSWDQVPSCYFPCLIYFFTRTMNLESDFKRSAQRKLSSGRIFKSTPVNCLKPLVVVVDLVSCLWQWQRPDYLLLLLLLFVCNNNITLTWLEPLASFTKVGGVRWIIAGGGELGRWKYMLSIDCLPVLLTLQTCTMAVIVRMACRCWLAKYCLIGQCCTCRPVISFQLTVADWLVNRSGD